MTVGDEIRFNLEREVERNIAAWLNYHSVDAKLNTADYLLAANLMAYQPLTIIDGKPRKGPSIIELIISAQAIGWLLDGPDRKTQQ